MPGTPLLQNCEPIERKLRRTIQGCWRELLKECKERDAHRRGAITAAEFLGGFCFWPWVTQPHLPLQARSLGTTGSVWWQWQAGHLDKHQY